GPPARFACDRLVPVFSPEALQALNAFSLAAVSLARVLATTFWQRPAAGSVAARCRATSRSGPKTSRGRSVPAMDALTASAVSGPKVGTRGHFLAAVSAVFAAAAAIRTFGSAVGHASALLPAGTAVGPR